MLKAASNNGKNTIYVVPIQEHLSTEPLPYDSPEFSKMPQSTCITCGSEMPLQLLPLHVGQCSGTITVRLYGNTSVITQLNMHIFCLFENLQIFCFLRAIHLGLVLMKIAMSLISQLNLPQGPEKGWEYLLR